VNNRSNSYVKDGVLHLKPTMTEDAIGTDALHTGSVNIWGGSPADQCTMNQFYGCERSAAASGNVINPVQSARVRTVNSFSTKYGRVEVRAKLPRGDWLWPAIWMLPKHNEYGTWPASGEIDIMESRGNDKGCSVGGIDHFGSTLHWGTDYANNKFQYTHKDYAHVEDLDGEFHTYGLYWDEKKLYTYFDKPENVVLSVDFDKSFFERGQFPASFANPWAGEPNSAPFNREFYIVMNLAVGGTSDYFPEGQCGKPWSNTDPHSVNAFHNARGAWLQTWKGEGTALKIDSVKVWSLDGQKEE
jgi:beta-glucanase (GH16 family)